MIVFLRERPKKAFFCHMRIEFRHKRSIIGYKTFKLQLFKEKTNKCHKNLIDWPNFLLFYSLH